MACMQQMKASCESDFSEKEKTVSKGSQGYTSSEHTKHDHKVGAYSNQGGGYQAVGANTHQVCNPASANKHNSHSSGHLSLTEKFTGMFGSTKPQQSSGCNTHGHQASSHVVAAHGHNGSNTHGHQASSHVVAAHGHNGSNTHGHQASSHVVAAHGHNGSNTHGHQASSHIVAGHGHSSSGCKTHGHSHHKATSQETYEFQEKKKEYTSSKSGQKKKVEKKIKKKSSYKCSSSDSSSDSDKEHC